ncbi:MAG: outer membrane lipoprotein-sorting protein [Sphingobacteriaceae bacterium]|nr:MAG: outer membrane lipoprotein-sorting protein [Sphingobacteriaceae bacterium]
MKKLFLGAALLSAVLTIKAQTVDEIVGKHLAAVGGKANLDKVKNVMMEGSMDAMGNKVDVKVVKVPGKLYRQDISVMGMNGYNIVTDTSGWMFMPFAGQTSPEPLSGDMLKGAQGELSIADALVDYQAKGNKLQLQGKEDIAGSDSYKMLVVSATGDSSTVYVDVNTSLITRTSVVRSMMGQEMTVNIDYSDYKDVDGLKFPFTMGMQQGTITFSSIKTNQTVDPKLYNRQ